MQDQRGLITKVQWTALVVLILAIIGLLVVLLIQQQDYRADAEFARSGPAVEQQPPEPTATPTGSAAPSTAAQAQTEAALAVVNGTDDAVISVLGDSSSDDDPAWVYLWAEELGEEASVVVHTWDEDAGDWSEATRQYGEGERTITIWNGSAEQGTPALPLTHDDLMHAQDADLVLLNYGHRGLPEDVEPALADLLQALDAGSQGNGSEDAAPVVLTAQNPATGPWVEISADNRELMRAAAAEHGLPLIDVEAAFEGYDNPEALLADAVNPNEQGSEVWADTVSDFFAR